VGNIRKGKASESETPRLKNTLSSGWPAARPVTAYLLLLYILYKSGKLRAGAGRGTGRYFRKNKEILSAVNPTVGTRSEARDELYVDLPHG
jgi:hypothetical protein